MKRLLPFLWILSLVSLTGCHLLPSQTTVCALPRPVAVVTVRVPTVAIQPLGRVPKDRIALAKATLEKRYGASVTVLPSQPLPREAYYPARGRYRADKLLTYLDRTADPKYDKVLALTEVDISTTKGEYADWGIFGLGSLGGRPCVVSSYRLRNADQTRFRARYDNLVTHEMGHTFGLDHCPTKGCVMQDAQGTVKTVDGETGEFCPTCRERLKGVGADSA